MAGGSIGCPCEAVDAAEYFQADPQAEPLDRLDAPDLALDLSDAADRSVAGLQRVLSFSSLFWR